MALLKSGIIIPELIDHLKQSGISVDTIQKYYNKYCCFELNTFQSIEYLKEDSILCIAYNILSRGYPTTGSLQLTTKVMMSHFPNNHVEFTSLNSGVYKLTFDPLLEKIFDEYEVRAFDSILLNWDKDKLALASTEFGSPISNIVALLEDLRKVAFTQKALLFAIFTHRKYDQLGVYIDINNKELAALILTDLNELIAALTTLSDRKLPILSCKSPQTADVIIGSSWGEYNNYDLFEKSLLTINAFPELFEYPDGETPKLRKPNLSLLSATKVDYSALGVSSSEDSKDIPDFHFYSEKKKAALLYLLSILFRKNSFRPGQLAIISRALQNKDVIGLLPTGGGKSLCFQLCGLLQPGLNIVVDPINSLMKDQFDKLQEYHISNVGFINSLNVSQVTYEADDNRSANDIQLERFEKGELLFLFISPERLLIKKFRNGLTNCVQAENIIHYAIIDEAHCVSEWGHDFRIPYLRLADNLRRFCAAGNNSPVLFALTATASYDVLSDIQREMGLQADSIISLPPEAINRKEINYHIEDLSSFINVSEIYPDREYDLGKPKYKALNKLFNEIPHLLSDNLFLPLPIDEEFVNIFYRKKDSGYPNAGIIFCTTRSINLPGGVVAMFKTLKEKYSFLNMGTYFSETDSETILETEIDITALDSVKNQEKFLKNELNLMICTKGFGMGIDKPNLRYTIHYSLPSSVESFYQESGRAGRDREKAVCSILYHPADEQTTMDFLEKSFRGVQKEMTILEELLTEIRFGPRFFLDILEDYLRSELNYPYRLKFFPETDPAFIYVNGPYEQNIEDQKCFGAIRLKDLTHYDPQLKNVAREDAENVVEHIRHFLKTEVPDGSYKAWITRKTNKGIKVLLNEQRIEFGGLLSLEIGFSNDGVNEVERLLKPVWNDINIVVIKAGYGFAHSPDQFVENLKHRYAVHLENLRKSQCENLGQPFFRRRARDVMNDLPILDESIVFELNAQFFRMRLVNDTQRAIYRLLQTGIIDDYYLDYAKEIVVVNFKKKDDRVYLQSLLDYLRRYLGEKAINEKIERYQHETLDAFLKPLKIITDFFQNEVKDKRIRGLKQMKDFCRIAITKGQDEFKQSIVLYFTSKYAKPEFLPGDLEEGRKEDIAVIGKYLKFIVDPPDGIGSDKDNVRHLLGACARLRIVIGNRNNTLNVLHAFSWLALADMRILDLEQEKSNQLLTELKDAIDHFGEQNGWLQTIIMLSEFSRSVININPEIESLIEKLIAESIEKRIQNVIAIVNQNLKPAIYGTN